MKIGVITDLHTKDSNISLVENICEQVSSLCKENNLNTLFVLGDLLVSRKMQSQEVLLSIKKQLEVLAKNSNVYVLVGNHDKTKTNSERSFLDIYNVRKVKIIRKDYLIKFDNVTIACLSYFDESGLYPKLLSKIVKGLDEAVDNYLFTHIAVNGVKNNDGSQVNNNLKPNVFKSFKKVFVGHYHDKSLVSNNIHYIGSGYQANFGEDKEKGLTILDLETGEHNQIVLDFPVYETFSIDIDDYNDDVLNDIVSIKNSQSCFVKLKLTGDSLKIKNLNKEKLLDAGIKVVNMGSDVIAEQEEVEKEYRILSDSQISESFESWISSKKPEDVEYGRNILKKITQ